MAINNTNNTYNIYNNTYRPGYGRVHNVFEIKVDDHTYKQIVNFASLYKANIQLTDEKIIRYKNDPISKMMEYDYEIPRKEDIDEVVNIKLPLTDLKHFMRNYENHMEIIDNLDDPRVQEMLSQLLMFIRLKT